MAEFSFFFVTAFYMSEEEEDGGSPSLENSQETRWILLVALKLPLKCALFGENFMINTVKSFDYSW